MRAARARALVLAMVSALVGCSYLVAPEDNAARCVVGQDMKDPCPGDTVCRKNRCVELACERREICGNGVDDDCDGMIDEANEGERELCNSIDDDCDGTIDEGHDNDGDGWTWCGDLVDRFTVDCDDFNRDISPGGTEACDGIDNDCDGITDEAPDAGALCGGADQLCLAGACVVPSCEIEEANLSCGPDESCVDAQCLPRCTAGSCPEGTFCDLQSGLCTPEVKVPNGGSCARTSDCHTGSCIDGAALRLSAGTRVCIQACCVDSDCPGGQSCFASGSGARSCLPGNRAPDGARQCASGEDGECGSDVCALGRYPGSSAPELSDFYTTVCRPRETAQGLPGSICYTDSACASRVCVPGPPLSFAGVCSTPCRSSADCQALPRNVAWSFSSDGPPTSYCRYTSSAEIVDGTSADDYVAVCVIARSETGGGGAFAPCTSGATCQDGACVGASAQAPGRCAPACCSDRQCGSLGSVGARCLPIARGGHFEMRCIQ